MHRLLMGAVIAATLMSVEARAQARATDAAIGAVSGAVVLGPIGAVAGALVGYTAGPAISSSWGLHRSESRYRPPRARPSSVATREQSVGSTNAPPPAPAAERPAGRTAPPVQGFD